MFLYDVKCIILIFFIVSKTQCVKLTIQCVKLMKKVIIFDDHGSIEEIAMNEEKGDFFSAILRLTVSYRTSENKTTFEVVTIEVPGRAEDQTTVELNERLSKLMEDHDHAESMEEKIRERMKNEDLDEEEIKESLQDVLSWIMIQKKRRQEIKKMKDLKSIAIVCDTESKIVNVKDRIVYSGFFGKECKCMVYDKTYVVEMSEMSEKKSHDFELSYVKEYETFYIRK